MGVTVSSSHVVSAAASSSWAVQGDGEWVLQSVHRTLSLLLLPAQGRTPHTLLLLQCGVLLMGDSSPQTSPT